MMPGRNHLYQPNYGDESEEPTTIKQKIFSECFYFLLKILQRLKEERNQNWDKSDLLFSKRFSCRSINYNLISTIAVMNNLRESTRSFIQTVPLATTRRGCGSSWRRSPPVWRAKSSQSTFPLWLRQSLLGVIGSR